jgi:two-component system, NarL family, nitrate/nitrite response regulator NarL
MICGKGGEEHLNRRATMSRVAVIVERSLVRAGLVNLLKSHGFDQVDEAASVEELTQCTPNSEAEIILVSLAPDTAICELMSEIVAWNSAAKVVFVALDFDIMALSKCFEAGASGYILESLAPEPFYNSLALASLGEKIFPSELAMHIPNIAQRHPTGRSNNLRNYELSDREMRVLELLSYGQPNKIIAARLNISEATVKLYLRSILRKLQVTNRTQAALWAVEHGIIIDHIPDVRKPALAS